MLSVDWTSYRCLRDGCGWTPTSKSSLEAYDEVVVHMTAGHDMQPLMRAADDLHSQYTSLFSLYQQLQEEHQRLKEENQNLKKDVQILKLSVPLEDELSGDIDEMCKHLAMEDGFTLSGIARLLIQCQRRMAADYEAIGSERLLRNATERMLVKQTEVADAAESSLLQQRSQIQQLMKFVRHAGPCEHQRFPYAPGDPEGRCICGLSELEALIRPTETR